MKKLMMAIFASAMLVITAHAESGTVHSVGVLADGNVQVVVDIVGDGAPTSLRYSNLVGTAESIKAMLALAITAKTTNTSVNVGYANGGWNRLSLQ